MQELIEKMEQISNPRRQWGNKRHKSPLNLNILRKQVLTLLNRADFGKRVSIRWKMFRAAMDNSALDQLA